MLGKSGCPTRKSGPEIQCKAPKIQSFSGIPGSFCSVGHHQSCTQKSLRDHVAWEANLGQFAKLGPNWCTIFLPLKVKFYLWHCRLISVFPRLEFLPHKIRLRTVLYRCVSVPSWLHPFIVSLAKPIPSFYHFHFNHSEVYVSEFHWIFIAFS